MNYFLYSMRVYLNAKLVISLFNKIALKTSRIIYNI